MSATLVFRQHRREGAGALPEAPAAGVAFRLVPGARSALAMARALARHLGWAAFGRALAKVATPSRLLFCVLLDGEVVVHGWLSIGRCALHPVEPRDVVIGPVRTVPPARSRGLATYGLRHALEAMSARGYDTFYVHAGERNHASRRWIARSGFGEPVAVVPAIRRPA